MALAGEGAGPVRLYSLPSGEPKWVGDSAGPATAVSFIGSGDRLATGHTDGTLVVWNLVTRSPLATVRAGPVVSLAASSNGSWLAAGGSDGVVQLWELASMTRTDVDPPPGSVVRGLTFSPDDRSLVSTYSVPSTQYPVLSTATPVSSPRSGGAEDSLICSWRVPDLARQYSVDGPGGAASALAFCLAGKTLATCGRDNRITLWSGSPPRVIGVLEARFTERLQTLAATPDGRTLVCGGGPRQPNGEPLGGVEAWNVEAIHRAVLDNGLADWFDADEQVGK